MFQTLCAPFLVGFFPMLPFVLIFQTLPVQLSLIFSNVLSSVCAVVIGMSNISEKSEAENIGTKQ